MKIQAAFVLSITALLGISGAALAEAFSEPSGFLPVTLRMGSGPALLGQVTPPQPNRVDSDDTVTCDGFCYLPPPEVSTPASGFNDGGQS
jgi:hypothetical protein